MADLMDLLLKNDHRATQKALRVYDKAVQRISKRYLKSKRTQILSADDIAECLEKRLTPSLEAIDLTDPARYRQVKSAIESWSPRLGSEDMELLQRCGLVQNILLCLLPQCRKKQQLMQICKRYQTHLQAVIEKEKIETTVSISTAQGKKSKLSERPKKELQRVTSPDELCSPDRPPVNLVIQKQAAVDELQKSFSTRKPVYDQLQEFNSIFSRQKRLIEKSRDSAAMTFLKGITTLLSGGLAIALGIWRSKGDGATQEIRNVLKAVEPA